MKIKIINTRRKTIWACICMLILASTQMPHISYAASDIDTQNLDPLITRKGGKFTAQLVPKAKNSSVLIDFEVQQNSLLNVEGVAFDSSHRTGADEKDFKSGLFLVKIEEFQPGEEVLFIISSDFFSESTDIWIFNQELSPPWINSESKSTVLPNRLRQFEIKIKDGGPFDSDGTPDGRIAMICGPRDSFWGYAIGTLIIRYFGIFIVLTLLMFGLLVSGKFFRSFEKKKAATPDETLSGPNAKAGESKKADGREVRNSEKPLCIEIAAAIAVALELQNASIKASIPVDLSTVEIGAWVQRGRQQIMGTRFLLRKHNDHYSIRRG